MQGVKTLTFMYFTEYLTVDIEVERTSFTQY